jgi:ribonuclease BN (tRNA processing enzyme)
MNGDGASVTFLGTGDAFGSGGRLQTCFHVRTRDIAFLIDCGATACLAMKRAGLTHADVDAVLLSHFHADHFAGLPFLIIEGRVIGRASPLSIAGPAGLHERVREATEVLFPGAGETMPRFPIEYLEYGDSTGAIITLGKHTRITTWPVTHAPATQPHALRIETGDRIIAYSGDTEWNPNLIDVARGADLFICEVSSFDGPTGIHLDYPTLLRHRSAFDCRRFVLTHMGDDVLDNAGAVAAGLDATLAYDGLVITI